MTSALAAARYGFCLVVTGDGIVLGRLRKSALQAAAPDATAEQLMEAGPSTVRPNAPAQALVERLTNQDLNTAIVTTPEGQLLGVFARDAAARQLAGG
jgi:CBS-domain-containing membrane protein